MKWAYPMCQAKVCFSSNPLLIAGSKDRIPTHHLSNVIYFFGCWCYSRYLGKTTQRREARMKQHIPAVLVKTARTTSAIGEDLFKNAACLDNFDRKRFIIVCRARSESVLHFLETLYTKKIKPDLCKQMEFAKCLFLFP